MLQFVLLFGLGFDILQKLNVAEQHLFIPPEIKQMDYHRYQQSKKRK